MKSYEVSNSSIMKMMLSGSSGILSYPGITETWKITKSSLTHTAAALTKTVEDLRV